VFSNLINNQTFHGKDFMEITVVSYGPGMRHLIATESRVAERVASLLAQGITCGAMLDAMGLGPEAALDGVQVVPNGLP